MGKEEVKKESKDNHYFGCCVLCGELKALRNRVCAECNERIKGVAERATRSIFGEW
ncbi:hypothetical protein ES703_88960 [subsurface metagenome]